MKPYTKLYMKHFQYDNSDFIPCEICNNQAVDIHHIKARGMGGTSQKDSIENLMALCRLCHMNFGDKKQHVEYLNMIHQKKLKRKKF